MAEKTRISISSEQQMKSALPFINIHTHRDDKDGISIVNILDVQLIDAVRPYISIGLHPWSITDGWQNDLDIINKNSANSNVVAIGECGLDKVIDIDLKLQETIFKQQIEIAKQVNKPMIIHCVKAFDDLIRIRKEMKITVPMIVHGYNNNLQIAEQLLKNNFYLSFGKALLNNNSNANKCISMIDINKIFLETDDADVRISTVYEAAATTLKLSIEELKQKMYENYKMLFKYE